MDFILGVAAGAIGAIVGLNAVLFYAGIVVTILFSLIALAGDESSPWWATLWGALVLIALVGRFSDWFTPLNIGLSVVAWLVGGILYSYVRLRIQSSHLRNWMDDTVNSALSLSRGNQFPIRVNTSNTSFRREFRIYIRVPRLDRMFSSKAEVIRTFTPEFADNRQLAIGWAVFWPIHLLYDCTINAIENIMDFLKEAFQGGMASSFARDGDASLPDQNPTALVESVDSEPGDGSPDGGDGSQNPRRRYVQVQD